MKCEYCEKELLKGDVYIHVGSEDVRYCHGCYSESTITRYSVGGEFVGTDEDGIEEYHQMKKEV